MVPKAQPRVTIQEDLEEEEEEFEFRIKNTFLDFDVPAPSTIQYSKSTPAPVSSMPVSLDYTVPITRGLNTKEETSEGEENVGKVPGSGGGQTWKAWKKGVENKKGGKRFNQQNRNTNHGYRGYAGDAEQAQYTQYGNEVQNQDFAYYAAAAQVATNAAVANAQAAEYYNAQAYNAQAYSAQAYNAQAYPTYQMPTAHYDGSYAPPIQNAAGTSSYKPKQQQKNKGQKGQGKEQRPNAAKATGTTASTKAVNQPEAEGRKGAEAEEGSTKYQCTFWIGIEDESLELSKKILGARGKTFKYIGNIARGTRLRLRGRGSSPNAPGDEPLHLRIISSQLPNFTIAKEKVTELLEQIYAQHETDTGEKVVINCVDSADNPTNA